MDSGTGWEETSVSIGTAVDSGNLMEDNGASGNDTTSLCCIARSVVSDTKSAGPDVKTCLTPEDNAGCR